MSYVSELTESGKLQSLDEGTILLPLYQEEIKESRKRYRHICKFSENSMTSLFSMRTGLQVREKISIEGLDILGEWEGFETFYVQN